MQYLALLGGDETLGPEPGTPEWDAEIAGHLRFGEIAGDAIVAGEALRPSSAATTVRRGDGGEPLVTTGPFAETTEAVGGFYVLEAATLDDAIELAREIPTAADGAVALRPLVMWQGPEGGGAASGERHVALIYGEEGPADMPGTPAWDEGAAEHGRFLEEVGDRVLAGGALHPLDTSTTVRVRDGELLVTHGPFSEAAEVVGGLYVIAASTADEAVAVASAIPVGAGGAVEVRPVLEVD